MMKFLAYGLPACSAVKMDSLVSVQMNAKEHLHQTVLSMSKPLEECTHYFDGMVTAHIKGFASYSKKNDPEKNRFADSPTSNPVEMDEGAMNILIGKQVETLVWDGDELKEGTFTVLIERFLALDKTEPLMNGKQRQAVGFIKAKKHEEAPDQWKDVITAFGAWEPSWEQKKIKFVSVSSKKMDQTIKQTGEWVAAQELENISEHTIKFSALGFIALESTHSEIVITIGGGNVTRLEYMRAQALPQHTHWYVFGFSRGRVNKGTAEPTIHDLCLESDILEGHVTMTHEARVNELQHSVNVSQVDLAAAEELAAFLYGAQQEELAAVLLELQQDIMAAVAQQAAALEEQGNESEDVLEPLQRTKSADDARPILPKVHVQTPRVESA